MRRETVTNEYFKKAFREIETLGEDTPDEVFERAMEELRHSRLIIAGDMKGDELKVPTLKSPVGEYGILFTDMAEFRKVFPDFPVEAHEHAIGLYIELLSNSNLDGFIVNFESDMFLLTREIFDLIDDVPENNFSTDDSYTSDELKQLKDSMNNDQLEEFINDPANIGKYEELFERISRSTMLTLRLAKDDLTDSAENGIISMVETGPIGYLYMDRSGKYATVFTSEEKISSVHTPMNRYSQIINFSQMTNSLLSDDMDG